jgi:hypothetical protein
LSLRSLVFIALLLSLALFSVHAFATYVPHQGDYFSYYEVQKLGSGTGDYSGYTEQTIINGTENVNGVAANGTVYAYYSYSWSFSNTTVSSETGSTSGNYTFSSNNFHYINGTDDETGYVNVWFCMDNSTPEGGTFNLLNTTMTVMSKNYSYYLPSQNRNVYAIFAQGSSSYQRNDVYGQFTATYTWNTYFDPSSGYIIGYNYTEYDTNSSGTGFTYTDNLYINSASYARALTTAPATSPGGNSDLVEDALLIAALVIIIAVILIILYLASRRRRLPKHPSQQPVYRPPSEPPPPPSPQDIDLTPKQAPVQQIVIKEVVKVKCRYCGALIDSTVERCPFCGAPRD